MAEGFSEAALEYGAGEGDVIGDFVDAETEAGVFTDEAYGGSDVAIFDSEHVGGAAGDDVPGGDEDSALGFGGTVDEFVEEGGGLVADAGVVGPDAGESGVGDFAEGFVVIDADHGNLIGDGGVGAATGFEHRRAALIRAEHEAEGFGLFAEPLGEVIGIVFPHSGVVDVSWGFVDGAGASCGVDGSGKGIAASDGPVFADEAEETEAFESAFEEVFGGEFGDADVVGMDEREAAGFDDAEDIDGGDAGCEDGVGDALILDADDDAVAAPFTEPGGDGFFEGTGFEEGGPGAMLADVS